MRRINGYFILSALVLSGLAPVSWAEDSFIQLSQEQIDNIGIKTGKPQPAKGIPSFSAPAKVVVPPAHEFIVSTASAGLVIKMNANVGDKVNKGEVLGLINSPNLLTLQSNYLKAVGALKLASATYQRDLTLRKEGVVSGRGEQEAYSAYNAAAIEVGEARQLLQISGMTAKEIKQLDSTGHLVSQISIRSPITGRVVERMAVSGSRVDNQTPLYRIANLDELWLEINIPQEHVGDIQIGDKILIENGMAEAEIKVLGQSVNPDNQAVQARAIIRGNPVSVRVGQKVTIQHMQTSTRAGYLVNDAAIAYNNGKPYVFIKQKDGFKVLAINVLGKQTGASVISGDISGDEDIAVNNAAALKAAWLGLGSGE